MQKTKFMNAWLLTWVGTNGPAQDQNKQVIAILNSRMPSSKVHNLVIFLYKRSVNSAFDMAANINKRTAGKRDYYHCESTEDRFFYGSNPWVFARRVVNLRVECDENCNTEHIYWTEQPYLRPEMPGALPTMVTGSSAEHVLRKMRPLGYDIH